VTPRHQISQTLASNRVDEGVGSVMRPGHPSPHPPPR
jgi:hypothetical protein